MFYCTNAYGTIFNVEVFDKRVKARLSTSEKKQDGSYENSYWNVVFIGNAYDAAKSLTDRDRIHITKCKITNETYKNKDGDKRSWLQVTVYEFEKLVYDDNTTNEVEDKPKKTKSKTKKEEPVEEISDDDLPF